MLDCRSADFGWHCVPVFAFQDEMLLGRSFAALACSSVVTLCTFKLDALSSHVQLNSIGFSSRCLMLMKLSVGRCMLLHLASGLQLSQRISVLYSTSGTVCFGVDAIVS